MGVATPAPFLFELVLWFSVTSVTAWAWLSFVQRRNRVRVVADEEEPPEEPPATSPQADR